MQSTLMFIEIILTIFVNTITCSTILTPNLISDENLTTLKSLHVVIRHGIRAPSSTYPLDPNINITNILYPNGPSQLTDAGIEQAYNGGKYFLERYGRFLKYNKKYAYLRSSAAQRCVDTISIISKVLWPSENNDDKQWQKMIFSLPKKIDKVLYEEPDCPLGDTEDAKSLNNSKVQNFNNRPNNQKLYAYVSKNTGLSAAMNSVTSAFDVVRCLKLNALPLPEWATPEIYEQIGDIYSNKLNFLYDTKKSQQLRAGPVLNEIKTKMDDVIRAKPGDNGNKIFFYGTHDFKIAAILSALGLPQSRYPPFLGAILFELHHHDRQTWVKLFYLNQTEHWPYTAVNLNPPKCVSRAFGECTYVDFVQTFTDLISTNWRKECGLDCDFDPFKAAEESLGKT